jgi:hypothetical protein
LWVGPKELAHKALLSRLSIQTLNLSDFVQCDAVFTKQAPVDDEETLFAFGREDGTVVFGRRFCGSDEGSQGHCSEVSVGLIYAEGPNILAVNTYVKSYCKCE